jgi:hypothetical protein
MAKTKQALDYEGLKLYDQQLKTYIDKKIAEAINTYREEDKADDNIFDDQSDEEIKEF